MNQERAQQFYQQEFDRHAATGRDHEISADVFNGINENWANTMILGSIGMIFFLAHGVGWSDHAVATTYSLTILFLRTSLTGMIAAVPSLIGGNVALDKLNSLQLPDYRPEFGNYAEPMPSTWHKLQFQNVSYRYPLTERGERFAVGPLNFNLHNGEVVFLIDEQPIDDRNRPAFCALFSSVFSDFHLFHHLLGINGADAEPDKIRYWLEKLSLSHKVEVKNSCLLNTRLSQGQRKRLALMIAILEDRPILVLDEWAADQDPGYRRRFYTEILPLLKAQGKTVIAVTHDEHYFHVADRIVKMDEGQWTEIKPVNTQYETLPPLVLSSVD